MSSVSSIADSLSRVIRESSNGTVPVAALVDLLQAATTAGAIAKPPPQVIVRWKSRGMIVSRDMLKSNSLTKLYVFFTEEVIDFNGSTSASPPAHYKRSMFGLYLPMRFYVTLLKGHGASEGEELDVPDYGLSWSSIVPTIDELHIFTLEEHLARRRGGPKSGDKTIHA